MCDLGRATWLKRRAEGIGQRAKRREQRAWNRGKSDQRIFEIPHLPLVNNSMIISEVNVVP